MSNNEVAVHDGIEQSGKTNLVQVVQRMQPEIQRALPKGMDGDRMARLTLTVLRQTPALMNCTPVSFVGALMTAAALGLEPGVDGEAHLVPYGSECTFIAGYKGLSKLYFQHPLARFLDAQTVYESDYFDYEKGLDPYLRHKPAHKPARGDRGEVLCFYAVASLTTGAKFFEVLTPAEVAAIRGASGKRKQSIADPQRWMSRKTALRQMFKLVPKTTALQHALALDERTGSELTAYGVPQQLSDGTLVLPPDQAEAPRRVTAAEIRREPEPEPDPVTGEVQTDQPTGYADPNTPLGPEPEGWEAKT